MGLFLFYHSALFLFGESFKDYLFLVDLLNVIFNYEETLKMHETSNKPLAGAAIAENSNRQNIQISDKFYDSNEYLSDLLKNSQNTRKDDSKEIEEFGTIFSDKNLKTFNSNEESTKSTDENLIGYFGQPTYINDDGERTNKEEIDDAEVEYEKFENEYLDLHQQTPSQRAEKDLPSQMITEYQVASLKMPETYSLKGIRSLISPALLQALASSGWEDDITIVDSTFPANHLIQQDRVIQLAGTPMVPLVKEIMKLWQLDKKNPLAIMVDEENKVIHDQCIDFVYPHYNKEKEINTY